MHKHNITKVLIPAIGLIAITLVAPEAFAATAMQSKITAINTELAGASTMIEGLIHGGGGKVVALVSLLLAILGSVMKFNPYLIAGSLAVAVTAGVGPAIINAMFTS